MDALKRLLEVIRATHPDVRSILLAAAPGGAAVYPSRRETPLWPNDDRELRDEDDCVYTLAGGDRWCAEVERPQAVARYAADGSIEIETFEDVPIESRDPRHLVLVFDAFIDDDERDATLRAIDTSQLDRLTVLRSEYLGAWFDLPADLDVSTIVLGFCKHGRQVGWQLVRTNHAYAVSLAGFDEEATLDALAGMLTAADDAPVLFVPSPCFQPTAADAEAVSKEYRPVVLSERERAEILRAREAERAAIDAELAAEAAEEARREGERFSADDCTAFVIYAIPSRTWPVEPGQPNLVMSDADELLVHFGRYEAPYPLVLGHGQLVDRLDSIPGCEALVDRIRDFAAAHATSWFICVLEPPSIAGHGTAIDLMGP